MRRGQLAWQVFIAVLAVALAAVLAVGVLTRLAFSSAFSAYVQTLTPMRQGMGMGRILVANAADQAFRNSVNRGVLVGALVALAVAAIAAVVLSRYLTRPLLRLEEGALELASGDLSHRVDVQGPAEVAALGEAFNSMADSLQESEELRKRLVADVAHELRNPIAAARAQAEGMAEGVLPCEPARLESVVEDLEHLSRLVDDLQELAAAEAGTLQYAMQPLDLSALAQREAERARAFAHENVEVRAETTGEVLVEADEQRLSQVVRNLFSNALRHTATGAVVVSVSAERGWAELRVADTGEGIPAEDVDHVFERFYRADTARAADTGGAGLGLAISRRIVEDHGGEVFAQSERGMGTTVGFRVPLAAGTARQEPHRGRRAAG
jgi:two-component system sensor histidine kinase BaeS